MAGNIEEIAALIKSIKVDNEINNEDFARLLNEIRNKVSDLHDYNENSEIIRGLQQVLDSKTVVDIDKINELDETLKDLKSRVDSSADIAELSEQVQALADNFRSGFNSVVTFANRDADAKNLLLDRMRDLETSVKNGEVIESLRHRTDELVRGYENFVSDSNLRHGNMVSTIVDLKNKIDEYSSRNNYTIGTIDHSISDTYAKITNLESTVSSHLGNVNSKLYSMGDDIQKILNDGFDHLKYLSSNISEAMNSNSLDVKTTLEVLKSSLSAFTNNLNEEFGTLNSDISDRMIADGEAQTLLGNNILTNVKELENVIIEKSNNYENLFNDKIGNVIDFISALQEAVSVMVAENNTQLSDRLAELRAQLQEFNTGYEKLLVNTVDEVRNVSAEVSKTSEEIVARLKESGFEEIEDVKKELLATSSSNLNAVIEKVQGISDSIDNYRNITADNLTSYLTTIRDLFEDFSAKVENSQDNTEVFDKLSNLENLMNKIDVEKNENFVQIQVMLNKNADSIAELMSSIKNSESFAALENLINERSSSKDEKLSNLEGLMNKINSEKNENFLQLQEMLQRNSEAIGVLIDSENTSENFAALENLINEQGLSKEEKLSGIENLLNRINSEKEDNFVRLQELLNKNTEAIEALNVRAGTSLGLEKIENLIREQGDLKSESLSNLTDLINKIDYEKNENYTQIQGMLSKNTESIEALLNNDRTSEGFQVLENLISEQRYSSEDKLSNLEVLVNKIDCEKNERFAQLHEILNKNAEALTVLENVAGNTGNFEALEHLITEFNISKDERLSNLEALVNKIDSEKNENFEHLRDLLNRNAEAIAVLNSNPEIAHNLEKLDNIEVLLSRIDLEKSESFAQLKEHLNRNIEAVEVLMSVADNSHNFESIENLINEQNNFKVEKLSRLEELVSKVDYEKNENFSQLKDILNRNTESIEILVRNSGTTYNLEKLDNIEFIVSQMDSSKNENFEKLQDLITKNTEAIEALNTDSQAVKSIESLSSLITEHSVMKDIKLDSLKTLVSEYKESVNKLSEDFSSQSEKNLNEISDLKMFAMEVLPKQSDINDLSTFIDNKVYDCTSSITEEIAAVKDSISAINEGLESILPVISDSPITARLNELNNQLTDASQNYEQSIAILNTRFSEYIESADNIAVIAKAQVETSAEEFDNIQSRFETLAEQINTLIGNSGLIEILANIRQQFNVVSEQIFNERNGIIEEFETSLTENVDNICSNLVLLRKNLEEEQERQSLNFEKTILDLETIKVDVGDILTQIESSISNKLEDLISEFEPFKTAINDFTGLNFANAINEIKHNIELSYVNLRNELGEDINENEIFVNIEQAYKESANKLSSLEDLIRYTIEDNINSINNTLFNVHNLAESNFSLLEDLQTSFQAELVGLETKIKESKNTIVTSVLDELAALKELINENQGLSADELRDMLLPVLENEELLALIKGLNKTLADKITEFKEDSELSAQDILDVVNSTSKTVTQVLDVINEKFEKSENNVSQIIEKFETVNAKLDAIVMACNGLETSNELIGINEKLEDLKTNVWAGAAVSENIKLLANKVDIIAAAQDNEIFSLDLDEIKDNLQNLVQNSEQVLKYGELINLISNKLDIIVSDDNVEFFDDSFGEIKDIITNFSENLSSKLEQYSKTEELLKKLNSKLDLVGQSDSNGIMEDISHINEIMFILKEDLASMENKLENYLRAMDSTLDVLSSAHEDNIRISNNIEDMKENISIFNANIQDVEKKLDVLAALDNSEILEETDEIKAVVNDINKKLDVIASSDDSDILEETNEIKTVINDINSKLDVIASSGNSDILEETDEIKAVVSSMDNKLDIVAQFSNDDVLVELDSLKDALDSSIEKFTSHSVKTDENLSKSFSELKEQISNAESNLEDYSRTIDYKLDEISQFTSVHEKLETIKSDVQENLKMEELINQLNNKVDILAMSDDSDVIDEIYNIKQLVEEQLESLQTSVADTEQVQKLMTALNKIDSNITDIDFSKQASEIKEAVISAVVSVTNEISFVEEADEIKDFVNAKTNELHRLLMDVKHQLYTITNTADDMDMYSYTLQDVESDIAKLRLVVNDFAGKNGANELAVISANLNKMAKAMDDLRNAVIEVEIQRAAKSDMPDINEQVVSISSRLNKFLLSRKDVDTQIIEKLDANFATVAELSSRNSLSNIENRLLGTDKKLENMNNVLTILKNVMSYLGEWMDGTTETLTSIYDKTSISEELSELKKMIPQKAEFISLIEKKFKQQEADIENLQNIVENTIAQNDLKADELQTIVENRIMKQEVRLDRIEKTLDRMTNILEAYGSNSDTMDRIEKMDEKLSRLNANIEKLAAYVE